MTRALKLAAQELRIPIVALSQLKRAEGTAPNRKPTLSDLRESGSIEQDSNMVLFLHAEAEYRSFEPGTAAPVTLTIAKQRSGPTDEIPMYFWPDRGLFREAQSD